MKNRSKWPLIGVCVIKHDRALALHRCTPAKRTATCSWTRLPPNSRAAPAEPPVITETVYDALINAGASSCNRGDCVLFPLRCPPLLWDAEPTQRSGLSGAERQTRWPFYSSLLVAEAFGRFSVPFFLEARSRNVDLSDWWFAVFAGFSWWSSAHRHQRARTRSGEHGER